MSWIFCSRVFHFQLKMAKGIHFSLDHLHEDLMTRSRLSDLIKIDLISTGYVYIHTFIRSGF